MKFFRTVALFLGLGLVNVAYSEPGILDRTQAQTAKAAKAEDLYQIRIQLKRASSGDAHTPAELQELAESYRILSGGFARFSHYKNSVEAYTAYLQFTEKLIDKTRQMQLDSIQQAHTRQEKAEQDEIAQLKASMNDLESRQASLANFRSNYFVWSGLAAGALLLFFLISLRSINRKIADTEKLVLENQNHTDILFREAVFSRIQTNIPVFLRTQASKNAEVLSGLTETDEGEQEPALFSGDFKKLLEGLSSRLKSLNG